MKTQKALHALLRQDLNSFIAKTFNEVVQGAVFVPNWHIQAIAYHLELVARGEINRLIISMPPRFLKSISASVAFPAWLLGRDPSRRIVCVSYGKELAQDHAHPMRKVMQSSIYRAVFPGTRFDAQKSPLKDLTTTKGGYRMSTSVGGTLTGRGGNLIIIDDIHKADEVQSDVTREATIAWYRNTLLSRLDHPDDPIIVIQQRLHERDLAGYLLETDDWEHLNLPATAEEDEWIEIGHEEDDWHFRKKGSLLHPERVSQQALDERRLALGSYNYAAQYQQRPVPLGGGIVKWDSFRFYDQIKHRRPDDRIVSSWDPAQSITENADWTVCTTWMIRENRFYLLDLLRFRARFSEVLASVIQEALRWRPNLILIEAVAHGISLCDLASREAGCRIMPVVPKGDKVSRLVGESAAIEAGYVYLPKEADWLVELQREIVNFPKGKHDDQVDSISQFLYWTRMLGSRRRQLQCRVTTVSAEPNYTREQIMNCPFP